MSSIIPILGQVHNLFLFDMKLIYWNIRGLAKAASRQALKSFCLSHNPDLLFISEPWINIEQVPSSFWRSLRLKPFTLNDR